MNKYNLKKVSIILFICCTLSFQNSFAQNESFFCRRNRIIAEGILCAASLGAYLYFNGKMRVYKKNGAIKELKNSELKRGIAFICACLSGCAFTAETTMAFLDKKDPDPDPDPNPIPDPDPDPIPDPIDDEKHKGYIAKMLSVFGDEKYSFKVEIKKDDENEPSYVISGIASSQNALEGINNSVCGLNNFLKNHSGNNDKQKERMCFFHNHIKYKKLNGGRIKRETFRAKIAKSFQLEF